MKVLILTRANYLLTFTPKLKCPVSANFSALLFILYFNDHAPPHFHAEYGGNEALYEIQTLQIYAGRLPRRAHNLVIEWADLHRAELLQDWEKARRGEPLADIKPLD
jgi:hypothetical protein